MCTMLFRIIIKKRGTDEPSHDSFVLNALVIANAQIRIIMSEASLLTNIMYASRQRQISFSRCFVFWAGVYSSFRLALFQGEKTIECQKTDGNKRQVITFFRRNNEKTPGEKTKNKSFKWHIFRMTFLVFFHRVTALLSLSKTHLS